MVPPRLKLVWFLVLSWCPLFGNINSSSQPGVLFVFDSWSCSKGGLVAFHREIVTELASRKKFSVYSTVVDVETEDQISCAKDFGISLIFPRVKKRLNGDIPSVHRLINHESYFPKLKKLNIHNVIGYAPRTANASAEIRDSLFPKARFVLINHFVPDHDHPSSYDIDLLATQMLNWAKEADALFSIGPLIHDHFQNEYRVSKTLFEKLHKEYLPRPGDSLFQYEMVLPPTIDNHVILTYGKMNHKRSCVDEVLLKAVNENGELQKQMHHKSLVWKVHGIEENSEIGCLWEHCGNSRVKVKLSRSLLVADLVKHIQQSYLCLISNCNEDYSFYGLEAVAVGLPLLTSEDSHVGKYLTKYFKKYRDRCIVANNIDSWKRKITDVLIDLVSAFDNAKNLKREFHKSDEVSFSHGKFAAVLKPEGGGSHAELPVSIEIKRKECHSVSFEDIRCIDEMDQHIYNDETNMEKKASQRTRVTSDIWQEILKFSNDHLKNRINEKDQHLLECIQKAVEQCGAIVKDIKTGSVYIILTFSNLYNLYTFEGKCRSGTFASLLEPSIITGELQRMAAAINMTMQVKAMYSPEYFANAEAVFIKRKFSKTTVHIYYEKDNSLGEKPCHVDVMQ
ncbi:uncharacterized protein [Ptychodera flava]|uniref:uncharacterized protein n=1 Tax=Ptychodera flava TaxID=63121 RepID=UPI00396A7FE3